VLADEVLGLRWLPEAALQRLTRTLQLVESPVAEFLDDFGPRDASLRGQRIESLKE
jgi:hypothetical protein